jgi:hypothetical protein
MKILKILLGLILALILIIAAIAVTTRMDGEKQYAKYAAATNEALKAFTLKPFQVKANYQHVQSLPIMDISVTSSTGDRLARVNSLDATMMLCMKMYTLMIRPSYDYNLPVMSVDFIFMPFGKRIYVIEIIDPAKIDDANKKTCYEKMKSQYLKVANLPSSGTRDWYKNFLTDFSIHSKAQKKDDDVLLAVYKAYLEAYLAMAKNAQQLPPETSLKMKEGLEKYVSTLLSQGGPAVEVFKKILGPEGQKDYVRTVMFGMD